MSASNVVRSLAQNIGTVLAGFAHFGSTGLVASQTLGYLFGMNRQSRTLKRDRKQLVSVTAGDLRRVCLKHRAQAIWSSPAAFANGFSYTVINYFIQFLYSSSVVGYYSLSFRMLGIPTNVIASNVSRVFAEQAARDKERTGNFSPLFLKTLFAMVAGSIPILIVLIIFSPELFSFVFGANWRAAGEYVQILAPMFVLRFIAAALNSSAMIAGKQRWDFLIQGLLIVSVILIFFVVANFEIDIKGMLFIINTSASIIYIMYITIFWWCSKCK